MKRTIVVVALCCAVAGLTVAAQQGQGQGQGTGQAVGQGTAMGQQGRGGAPPTLVAEVQGMFNNIKKYITEAADRFPEDKYGWSPTPDIRTWGDLMGHIADDNFGTCSTVTGDTAPARLDNNGKATDAAKGFTKADYVKALAASFAVCDKAFASVTPENMMERAGRRSKLGALMYDTQHINEHYGNIVTYMRLQGLVPPSTADSSMGRGRGGW
jgi:hypothetical protein